MTWPTAAVNTANVDQTTDSPASARADILDAIQKLNVMIANAPLIPDTYGHIGVGGLSSWVSTVQALEFSNGGSVSSAGGTLTLASNAYADSLSTWRYKANGPAVVVNIGPGSYNFYTAVSGTAGAIVPWILVASMDGAGAFGFGTSPVDGINAAIQTKDGIKFPSTAVLSSDANVLDQYAEGFFTGTLTGCTTSPSFAQEYTIVGNVCNLTLSTLSGTSNSTSMSVTGLPIACRPQYQCMVPIRVRDNGGGYVWGLAVIEPTGSISLYSTPAQAGFTASGVKGIGNGSVSYCLL